MNSKKVQSKGVPCVTIKYEQMDGLVEVHSFSEPFTHYEQQSVNRYQDITFNKKDGWRLDISKGNRDEFVYSRYTTSNDDMLDYSEKLIQAFDEFKDVRKSEKLKLVSTDVSKKLVTAVTNAKRFVSQVNDQQVQQERDSVEKEFKHGQSQLSLTLTEADLDFAKEQTIELTDTDLECLNDHSTLNVSDMLC